MNSDFIKMLGGTALRHAATFIAGYLIMKGVATQDQSPQIIAAVMTIGAVGWSIYQKYGHAALLATLGSHVPAAKIPPATLGAILIGFLILHGAPAHAGPIDANGNKVSKVNATKNPITVLQTFTVADLQAAQADALAQTPPDTTAANCYSALIPIVQSGASNPLPKGLGGFQLLQKGRDLKAAIANLQSPNGPLASLNQACAPLVLDTQNTLIQLGIIGGGVIATSGITLPFGIP